MRQQRADHAGMGDDHRLRHGERSHEIERPPLQVARRFAARRCVARDIGRQASVRRAEYHPNDALPLAEMHLGQAVVNHRPGVQHVANSWQRRKGLVHTGKP